MRGGLPKRGNLDDGERMMRLPVAVGLALGVAGCGHNSHQLPANQQSASEKTTAPSEAANWQANADQQTVVASTGPSATAARNGNSLGSLPPANDALRFVGVWATSQANCASRAWRFTAKTVTATDGPNCIFYNVAKVPGGYDLAAQCSTKKPVAADLIKLRFAESARAMLVESNAIAPTGLIYCGK